MSERNRRVMPAWSHPIRIPEGIELTHAEPPFATARETSTWRVPFVLAEHVDAGEELALQVFNARNNKFTFTRGDEPLADCVVLYGPQDAILPLAPGEKPGTLVFHAPEGDLPAGSHATAVFANVTAPRERVLNKFFLLHRTGGETALSTVIAPHNNAAIVAACTMHVLGGATDRLRAYAPAQCAPGGEIAVLVRPEDTLGNLSSEPLEDVRVFLGDEDVTVDVTPDPESACARVTVRLDAVGVHRVTVRDVASGLQATANPCVCGTGDRNVYWGMIHGHTELSDGTGTIEQYFTQMRDEAALDFAAPGDHDHFWETPDEYWAVTCEAVRRYNAPGRFVTLPGYEYAKWRKDGDGDRNVYYLDDDPPMYRSDEANFPHPPDLFARLAGEDALVIPHHTGHAGNPCDFKDHDPVHERLIEIYQVRGSYECSAEDGNPVPEPHTQPEPLGFVRRALALGWRVGFTAGGDDHISHAGTDYPRPWDRGHLNAGLMSVAASGLTRRGVWDALRNRRVVATTGPRMILGWTLDGHAMGSELSAVDEPRLAKRRKISVTFHGTAPIESIHVIRSGEPVHAVEPDGLDAEIEWIDESPLADAMLPAAEHCDHPFAYYYVRVIQRDGEVAWASPVWID